MSEEFFSSRICTKCTGEVGNYAMMRQLKALNTQR